MVSGELSEPFPVKSGIWQGLSPITFAISRYSKVTRVRYSAGSDNTRATSARRIGLKHISSALVDDDSTLFPEWAQYLKPTLGIGNRLGRYLNSEQSRPRLN